MDEYEFLGPERCDGTLAPIRRERSRRAGLVTIGPNTIRQLNIFAHKATLCLYFEHFKQPLPNSGKVSAHWRTKEDFSKDGVPPVLLEIFPKYATLIQGSWNSAETFEYHYDLNGKDGLFGCLALSLIHISEPTRR